MELLLWLPGDFHCASLQQQPAECVHLFCINERTSQNVIKVRENPEMEREKLEPAATEYPHEVQINS